MDGNRVTEPLIKIVNLKKWFPLRLGFFSTLVSRKQLYVRAVDGISFEVAEKEIFGLAGESGSGKTTVGRLLLKLVPPTGGEILFRGKNVTKMSEKEFKPLRSKFQIIFQDPYGSLNPRMTIFNIIAEPMRIYGIKDEREVEKRVSKALEDARLVPPEEFINRYPHELSGGQRQRVATGRALVLNPDFIVADEPVSMLDVSIRADILNLMYELKDKYNVSFLYVTHDLALARHVCDRIAIMYLGKIMEMGTTDQIVYEPLHPYTKSLMAAVPVPDPTAKRIDVVIKGEIPSPVNPPKGCRFHTRCPQKIGDICETKEPTIIDSGNGHLVACHLYT